MIKNANLSKDNEGVKLEEKHFIKNQLFHPLGVAPGVVVHGEGDGDPVPPGLESLHAEELPRQLVLQLGGQFRTEGGGGPLS